MQVDGIEPLCPIAQTQVEDAIAAVTNALNDENPTSLAMKQMGFAVPDWQCTGTVPFSSAQMEWCKLPKCGNLSDWGCGIRSG